LQPRTKLLSRTSIAICNSLQNENKCQPSLQLWAT
jgi:hypothetical protein